MKDLNHDDRVLAWLLLVIGGVRLVIAVGAHEVFGAEATIALLMVAIAVLLEWRR